MKFFIKLNFISILLAVILLFVIESMLNIYRINRITNINFDLITLIILGIYLILLVVIPILSYKILPFYLGQTKKNYLSILLFIPYFSILLKAFTSTFPMSNRGDIPNPIMGLFMIAELIFYPIFLFITINISNNRKI